MPSVLNGLETPNTSPVAPNTNSVLGAMPPQQHQQPEMRAISDVKSIRSNIYNRVLDGVNKIGPLSNSRHTLQLSNVRYVDPEDVTIAKQKEAVLTGKTLQRRLRGTWTLTDNATGKPLDTREMTIAQVPYFTPRGTFTLNGTEYGLSNQLRLRPGIFTRVKENGELESHVNVMPGNGFSHRYFLDPESGVFKISIGQAKLPLYPVLRAIGVQDSVIRDAWGKELHAANVTTTDNKTVNKLYQRMVRKADPNANDEQKNKAIADTLLAMKLDPEVTKRTLGKAYENLSTDAILDTTKKLIRVSRQEEDADDRDHMAYQTLHGPEDLLSERITKDKAFLRNLLFKVSFKGNLSGLQPNALTRQLHAVIMNSGLGNPLEEVNRGETLDALHRVSRLGVGGIESLDTIPDDSRSVHPSQANFIDSLKTPECFCKDTEVFTKMGWRRWDAVTENDEFACLINERMEFHKATRLIEADYTGPMYGLRTQRTEYLVTPNHRIYTNPANHKSVNWRFELANEAHGKPREFMAGGYLPYLGRDIATFTLPVIVQNHVPSSIFAPFNMLDWAEFMGWYLTEGFTTYSERKSRYCTNIAQSYTANRDKTERIIALLNRMRLTWYYDKRRGNFAINGKQLAAYTNQFGLCDEKYIPEYLLECQIEARQVLYDAMMMGDGGYYTNSGRYCAYTSTSKRLAYDFQRLAISLGYATNVRKYADNREARYLYTYVVYVYKNPKKVAQKPKYYYIQNYTGKVYCATVPGGLLYVRRGAGCGHWSGNSEKAGIDTRLAWATKKGSDGKMYAEILNPKTGKLEYKAPQDIADYVVAFPGELQKNKPYVAAMAKGQTVYVPRDQVQYAMPHAENWFSPLTNMIPMKSGLKGQRASMGARFLSQALSLTSREAPLVQSGMPGKHMDRSFEDEYGTGLGAVRAEQPGYVQKVTPDGIVVKHDDGTTKEYELYNHFPFARKSYGHNESVVRPGQRIDKDALLAKSNFTDDNGTAALGLNARVAFIGAHGNSFEDAVAISESFAKKLTSEHMYQHAHDWSDKTKKGTKSFVSLFPTEYSKEQLTNMDENGIVKPGTVVKYGDPLVLVAEERERTHSQIHKGRKPSYSNKTITWEHHSPGVITDAAQTSKGVNVAVKAYSPMQVGDKLSNRFGGKGIVSKIIPDDQMFHDKDGTPYDIAMNPLGMISRINPAQIVEMALGKIAAKTGKPYKVEDFSNIEDLSEFARQELKKHGMDYTDVIHDPTTGREIPGVNTGMQYLLKLHHTSESKAQGLGLGAYSNEEVPARGGEGDNPKKIALLETNALLSHGACFLGDIKVYVEEDGFVEIKEIVGRRLECNVACVDITTGKLVYRKVTDWLCRSVPSEDLLKIEANVDIPGNHHIFPIKCTKGHTFYTTRGKIQAHELVVGDEVISINQEMEVVPAKVRSITPYKPMYYEYNIVYNITVEEHHNYIANGVLVGNSEVLRDAHLVRGQKNDAYWQAFMSGFRPPEPQVPLVYRKYVDSLKASGINVVRDGQQMHLMALTNNDVKKLTGGSELENTDTVDWKEGLKPKKGGFFDPALTGGHGGNKWTSIKLDESLPNPAFEEPIRRLLNLTQKRYEGVLAGVDSLDNFGTGPEAIYNALTNVNVPKAIQQARAEIAGGKKSIRDDAIRKLSYLKTLERTNMQPKDWVLTHVPVLPPSYRPISVMANTGNQLVSDANYLYKELFDANQTLKDAKEANIGDYSQERMNVYNAFKGVVGLGDPIQPKNQERQVTGILKNVFGKGGPKYSMLQRQLMGANTELVGRAVISPNPDLDMDSVGIPEEKAWEVYKPFVIRRLVHKGVPRLEAARAFRDKTDMAKQSLLAEMGERPVVISRAPSLHRYNVMAAWPRLTKSSVMEVSPLVVKGFAADFDGDTMNFHVTGTDEAKKETIEKLLPSRNLLAASDFRAHYVPSMEYLGGLYHASTAKDDKRRPHVFRSKEDAKKAYAEGRIDLKTPVEIVEH